jgi:hypothetical protein
MSRLYPLPSRPSAARRALAAAPAVLLALAPELARACAVCGAGADEDESRVAYLLTTLALSVLPLGLFGGFVIWLRRQYRRRQTAGSTR